MDRIGKLVLILAVLSAPVPASANAGTPMMWAGMLHLVIGNLIIGLIEGSLLALVFRVSWQKATRLMVAANYVSAFAGAVGLGVLSGALPHTPLAWLMRSPLYDAPKLLWATAIVLFLATVLIEYPFCLAVLRRGKERRAGIYRQALLASFIAQVVSYSLLVPYYLAASPTTVFTSVKTDRSLSFARGKKGTVFYIGPGGDVLSIGVDGSRRRRLLDAGIRDIGRRLFVRKSRESGMWDLYVSGNNRGTHERLLINGFARHAAPSWRSIHGSHATREEEEMWADFGPASDLRPENERDWTVRTGFWAAEGLSARNTKAGKSLHIALETPFLSWNARNATVLPGDLVVFQLGDQIVLLDLNMRRMGLLAMGRGPVVTLDEADL